jgi:hypothetical protein
MRSLIVLVILAGCTDFDDLTRNICGNGLVEAGEDCDSSDPTCVRCAVSCSIDDDCPSDAYACGVDGFCHAPSGDLARPSAPVTFQADELRVTDVDHDGRGDVLGISRTSLTVRYGDAAGALSAGDSLITPAQTGPASFGDLDGDGSLDVTLATTEGLVTYTSAFGSLSPLDVEMPLRDGTTGEPIDFISIQAIGPLQFVAFGVADGFVILFVFDFVDEDRFAAAPPCLARLNAIPRASFDIDRVDLYRVHADGAANKNVVLSFTTASGQTCVSSITGSTSAGYSINDITPATGILAKKPILADLEGDADPCPGLVSSDGGPAAMKVWDGALAGGRCGFAASASTLPAFPGAPANTFAIGRIPIKPAIPFLSSDGLVMTNGLYGTAVGVVVPLYLSSRALAHVVFGDLDGDGDIDAAAAPATEDDIDILYRYPEGVELLRYDTASRVTSLTVGDYDGNGIGDFAYTEAAIGHQKLYVAYGTTDRHLAPLQVAAFHDVASVTPFEFRDSLDNLSVADDLLVLQPPVGMATATTTLLHGSPQRTMLSFLDPRIDANADKSTVRATVAGNFGGDDHTDLVVLAAPNADQQALGMRAYRTLGTADGLETTQSAGTIVDGLADCQLANPTGACVQDALYLAWPRAAGDIVIAVDRRPTNVRAIRIDPGQPARPITALTDDLPAGARVQSLHAYDVDGDGTLELIAAFTGSVRICDVDSDGMPTACEDIAPALPKTTLACIDAAPGRVGERGVIVLCREGTTSTIFRITKHAGVLAATELAQGVSLRSLRVDDVTGDGVDDVVAVQGDGSASALVVFPQCTTRDVAACRQTTKEAQ